MTNKEALAAAKKELKKKLRERVSADMLALRKSMGVKKGKRSGNNSKRRKRQKGAAEAVVNGISEAGRTTGTAGT